MHRRCTGVFVEVNCTALRKTILSDVMKDLLDTVSV